MEADIINVQRFSIHDGPGIRTTVFFKGCNLRCVWCHNPESQHSLPERMFFRHKCTGCGECRKICPRAFDMQCRACGKCISVCRYGARQISGEKISVEALLREMERDKDFYAVSGGGVTFSGGEPLLQVIFLEEILKRCRERQISTAVETAGNVPWEHIEKLLPYLDLILYDIKALDDEKHKAFTGTSNRRILENARKLMELSRRNIFRGKICFRMPVIPGYNDSEYSKAAEFVSPNPLELLPYHSIGMGKYEALGREYQLKDVKPPTAERLREMAEKYENVFYEENGMI